jgi:ADP-ribose pyrophosphatase YjhB (NUDIX family)
MTTQYNYYESLTKKRMGSGCLLFNQRNEVLLVKPTYKPVWEIPGGVVEQNESPKQCCQREVFEEIGLNREIGPLLVVDYNSHCEAKTESIMFVFDGGTLLGSEISAIQLQDDELSECAFFGQDTLPEAMTKTLKARVLAAWRQRSQSQAIYIENQQKA